MIIIILIIGLMNIQMMKIYDNKNKKYVFSRWFYYNKKYVLDIDFIKIGFLRTNQDFVYQTETINKYWINIEDSRLLNDNEANLLFDAVLSPKIISQFKELIPEYHLNKTYIKWEKNKLTKDFNI